MASMPGMEITMLELTEQPGLEPEAMVRLGLVHYNTAEEVTRLITALKEIPKLG